MNKPLRVLMLEDNPTDAELVIRELRRADFDPQWQRVENEADFTRALATVPEVILADYSLPGWDALDALAIVQARGVDIPFLIVSGTIGEEDAVAAMRNGAADYLLKDRLGRLGTAVEHALEQKRLRDGHRADLEALGRSNERFELIARATKDAIWDWDFQANTLWWNDNYYSLFGYTEADTKPGAESWRDFLHPDDQQRVQNGIHAAISARRADWTDEYRFRRRDGTYAHVLDRGIVVRDGTGRPIRMLGAMTDITERKQAEAVLQRHAAELERFNRLSVGRELRMIELKQEINELARLAGRPQPHDLAFLAAKPTPPNPLRIP